MSLAEQSKILVSSVKKIENGEIASLDSLMSVLRIFWELDIFSPLLKEEDMSPNEYFEFVEANKKKQRKRAKSTSSTNTTFSQEESEW